MGPSVFVNTSGRQFLCKLILGQCQMQRLCSVGPYVKARPFHSSYRLSVGDGTKNGQSSQGSDILESSSATAQWKRNHYRKIEDKFNPLRKQDENKTTKENGTSSSNAKGSTEQLEPLNIDNYEDVQPMWKEMESRVTKRRSLTLEQRGGVSGRRNVRKSEEDMWLEAGVYDSDKSKNE